MEFSTPATAQQCQTVQTASGGTVQSCDGGSQPSQNATSSVSNISGLAPVVNKYVLMKHPKYGAKELGRLDPEFDVDRYIRDHPGEFSEFGKIGPLAPAHLGMYVTNFDPWNAISAFGGGALIDNDGYRIRDSAGLIAPRTKSAGFDDTVGGGGIEGSLDATRALGLGPNQTLIFSGFFDYSHDDTGYDRTPAQVAADIFTGSLDRNTYTFGGRFEYDVNTLYVRGLGAFNFGDGDLENHLTGGNGDFDSDGYLLDLRLGKVFTLANTIGSSGRGRILGLDVSGNVGYSQQEDDGFTDSTGFRYGSDKIEAGLIGGRAKLFALIPNGSHIWEPYVAATVDGDFDFSHALILPAQTAAIDLPASDKIHFSDDDTFWGVDAGVELFCASGVRGGIGGFYTASSETSIGGGRGYLKVPF